VGQKEFNQVIKKPMQEKSQNKHPKLGGFSNISHRCNNVKCLSFHLQKKIQKIP
jgi:hypothetical protein